MVRQARLSKEQERQVMERLLRRWEKARLEEIRQAIDKAIDHVASKAKVKCGQN